MPRFLISYDLQNTNPSPYSEFLNQAAAVGWKAWILSDNGIWFRLPNTTLVGEFADHASALKAFEQACTQTRSKGYTIKVEKYILVDYLVANFASDVTQKPVS